MKFEPFGPLDPALYRETVRRALAEDLGWGDATTEATILVEQRARGVVRTREACIVAGLDIAVEAFRQLDPAIQVEIECADGTPADAGARLATLRGRAQALLTAERVALNFLARLSGVATLTRAFVDAAGGKVVVLDTRKTTPLWRVLERYAVRAGGGTNHRMALDEGVLIKESHVRLVGSIAEALRRTQVAQPDLPVQVEVRTLQEADEAVSAGATRLVAVDLSDGDLATLVERASGKAQIEVAGAVTLETIRQVAKVGVEYVSVGAITQSATWIDVALEVAPAD